ncbi:hypothetical protein AAC387_Pa12g1006 [Persea americana]
MHSDLEFYSRVLNNGDIYRADYEGLYCVNCEEYKNPPSQINRESGIQEMEISSFFLPSIVAFLVLVFKIQSYPTEQQVKDRVHGLPGQGSFNVSFGHYSGYVTVNKESGRSLF